MPHYKVESSASWFIVFSDNKAGAHKEGVKEYGRGFVTNVTKATRDDIRYFKNIKGDSAIEKV